MKRLLYFILIVILFPACTERMVETTGSVYGTVQDAKTGNPLNNCNVLLNPLGRSTTTGSDGSFHFTNIEGGEYTIQANKIGYATNSKNITVVPGDKSRADILLYDATSTVGKIYGTITDISSGSPVPGCNVVILPSGESVTTGDDGAYVWANLQPGEYSIQVVKRNYHTARKNNLIVNAGEPLQIDFQLSSFGANERLPEIGGVSISTITSSSIRAESFVIDQGSSSINERGFVYGFSPELTVDNGTKIIARSGDNSRFYAEVNNLQPSTRYYIISYAINSFGVTYSTIESFTTKDNTIDNPETVIYVSLKGDDNNDGSSWQKAKRTIQAALNAAKPKTEIWVSVGEYDRIYDYSAYLVSIYGGFSGQETSKDQRTRKSYVAGIYFTGNGYPAIIDGFIVSEQSGTPFYPVVSVGSNITIRNCEFLRNTNHIVNGGTIENCIFLENRSTTSALILASSATVSNSKFVNNDCSERPTSMPNTIKKANLINCLIANNGLIWYIEEACNCTIVNNDNVEISTIYNSIIWNNRSVSTTHEDGNITVNGNTNESILFMNPAFWIGAGIDNWETYDYRLSAGSVCINNGINLYYPIDDYPTDLDSNPRISDSVIDIGAYEY